MKSRKLFTISLILFLAIGSTASAQLRFGIRGEVGINKASLNKDLYAVENMNAFKVGPTVEFMLPVLGLGVDGSLLYSNEKMNVSAVNAQGTKTLIEEISSHSIDIPVNLKYKMGIISPLKVFIAAGPYANFQVGSNGFKYEALKDKVEAKKFEAGINLGLGAEVINRIAIGFNYRMKLTDDYSVNQPEFKDILNNKKGIWSLTAAVYF
ncbi:MAG: porin family protein [Bacteroidia bacterium]|nr:porin family protein [Bacteroidia bacterium]